MYDEIADSHADDAEQVSKPPSQSERSRYKFPIELAGLLELDRNPWYLIKGLMPKTGLHILYGAPGTGKSFVGLDAALHVATGWSWGGRRVRQADVVYVASEGGAGFRLRVIAAVAALREKGCMEDARFGLITVAPNLGRQHSDRDRLVSEIREQSLQLGLQPKLIVLDTLARSCQGLDESNTRDMNDFIANAMVLGARLGALVMPIHHSGKDEERGMRGSSALLGAADAVWRLRSEDELKQIQVEKMKDAESGSSLAFKLRPYNLDLDSDGDPMQTLVVDVEGQTDEPASRAADGRPPRRYTTLARIAATLTEHGTATEGSMHAKAMGLAELKALLTRKIEGTNAIRSEASAINRDIQNLVGEKLLERCDDRILWPLVA